MDEGEEETGREVIVVPPRADQLEMSVNRV